MFRKVDAHRFRGLYNRGDRTLTPTGYNWRLENMGFQGDNLVSRDGLRSRLTRLNSNRRGVLRAFDFQKSDAEANRFLFLSNELDSDGEPAGRFYSSLDLSDPILELPGVDDFSALSFYNRLYITPHNKIEGTSGEFIYVWEGSGSPRKAAGTQPTETFQLSELDLTGRINTGIHLFAIAYQTESGYNTKPGPENPPGILATGNKQIRLSGIDSGPDYVTKRLVLATRTIFGFELINGLLSGNPFAHPFYFVPNGIINNNDDDESIDLNFYDEELLDESGYLFLQAEELRAGLGLCAYNGRMCYWGVDGEPSVVRVSRRNQPESFSALDGFCVVDPQDSGGIRNCWGLRQTLYISRSDKTYNVSDTGSAPATWPIGAVDLGIGTEINGVATILDTRGTNNDYTLVATKRGLMLFDGVFRQPEVSWNIEHLWEGIKDFKITQIAHDSVKRKIYVVVNTQGDYKETVAREGSTKSGGFYTETVTTGGKDYVQLTYPNPESSIADALVHEAITKSYSKGDLFGVHQGVLKYYYRAITSPTFGGIGAREVLLEFLGDYAVEPLHLADDGDEFDFFSVQQQAQRIFVCDYDLGWERPRWSLYNYGVDVTGSLISDRKLWIYGGNGFYENDELTLADDGDDVDQFFGIGPLSKMEQMTQHGRVYFVARGSAIIGMKLHEGHTEDDVETEITIANNQTQHEIINYGIRNKGLYDFRVDGKFNLSSIRFEIQKAWDRLFA